LAERVVRFDDVSLGYGKRLVLQGLSFDIRQGEFLGIIGPNGAGKTTLLRGILGLIRPRAGCISLEGALHYGYVMQRQFLDTLFPFTVVDVVCMGRFGRKRAWSRLDQKDYQTVGDALEITGLAGIKDRLYRELSGGQKQRALIARALASQPDILLLDEPTNDMDVKGENQIMGLVQEIQQKRGLTIVLVSHLLHVVLNYAERLMFLSDGKAHLYSIDELVSKDLLSKIYGFPIRVGLSEGKRYLISGE
jgi:ABC-type cobalamin/Fe3+-siderophores transport system ATPase subunit